MATSIFTVGGTVQASKRLYLTRKADEELFELCQSGTFAYVLAPRQLGKSSLMLQTANRLSQQAIRSVIIDLTQLGTQVTAEAWYLGLLTIIEDQLMLPTSAVQWWKAHGDLGITQRLTRFFEEVVVREVDGQVVIFVDEIDTTLSLTFTDDFFAAIRYFYQARVRLPQFQRLSFVLIGVATPGDLIRDPARTPFNIGQRLDMTDFSFEEALPLAQGLGLLPDAARQVLGWILEWTGGHPYLTQRLCRVITQQKEKQSWTKTEIDELVTNTFLGNKSEQDNNIQFVRDMLTKRATNQEEVLLTYRDIRAGKRLVIDQEQSLVKSHLKLSGVVKREGPALRVRNAIYRTVFDEQWIKEHLPINWRKRLKQAAGLIVASLALTLLMGGLAAYAFVQQGQADLSRREAQAQTLALRAQTVSDPELSLLLTIEAAKPIVTGQLKDSNGQVESALRQSIQNSHLRTVMPVNSSLISATFSSDGKSVLTASEDSTARIWETSTGKLLNVLGPHPNKVIEAVFSPDGRLVATNCADNNIRLWDSATGQLVKLIGESQERIQHIAFSPDSTLLVVATADNIVRLWEVATGQKLRELKGHMGSITDASFSADGKLIVSTSRDRTARVWESATGQPMAVFRGHSRAVVAAVFSPDGTRIATISDGEATIWVWETATGKEVTRISIRIGTVTRVRFSPDGKWLVDSNPDPQTNFITQNPRIWEIATGKELFVLRGHGGLATSASFSPDGRWVVTSSVDGTTIIWDATTGQKLTDLRGHTDAVITAAFSADSHFVVTASADGTARVWEISRSPIKNQLVGHQADITGAIFNADGRLAATASSDGTAIVWNAASGQKVATMQGHPSSILSLAFSPDSSLLITGGVDGMARVWETSSGKELMMTSSSRGPLNWVKFSADGKLFLTSDAFKGTIQLWEVNSGKQVNTFPIWDQTTAGIYLVQLSATGKVAVTANPPTTRNLPSGSSVAQIVEVSTHKVLFELRGHSGPINSLVISPDDKLVGTASADGTARIWELSTGKVISILGGHQGQVNTVSFSADSNFVTTSSSDGTARIWETYSGREVAVLRGQSGEVTTAAFSPDGRYIITGGRDQLAQIYECEVCQPLAKLLTLAQKRVTRQLTPEERKQYGLE